jgi:predicted nucleotidyltransferase component of viral defense system
MKYSASYMSEIARTTGFDPANLEKALHLKEILREFARHPFLQRRLVLKGGTAVNLFMLDLPRLSVDVDLNYVGQIERAEMLKERSLLQQAVTQVCRGLGYQLQAGTNEHALREYYLGFTNHADRNDHIQVEINFLMRTCALPPAQLEAARLADEPDCTFSVLAVEELMAGKLKAMIERSHPRDLYDLHRFQEASGNYDAELLRKLTVLFASTLDRDLRDYEPERYSHIDQADIERLLYPLLRAHDRPSAGKMMTAVKPLLVAALDHKKEKPYLDAMAGGRYRPELLFPEYPEVGVRVARHPALLWKARNVAEHLSRQTARKTPRQ